MDNTSKKPDLQLLSEWIDLKTDKSNETATMIIEKITEMLKNKEKNKMDNKTAEQFLSRGKGDFINCTDYDDAIKAMHDFAQHQTEALRDENSILTRSKELLVNDNLSLQNELTQLRADNERMRAAIKIAATDCSLGMTGLDFTLKDIKNYLESILTHKD